MLTDEQKLRIATYGTLNDIWRVEARFSHIDKPVTYMTDGDNMDGRKPEPKRDAYQKVADWLMSENIQRIQVFKNDKLHQSITVQETPGV